MFDLNIKANLLKQKYIFYLIFILLLPVCLLIIEPIVNFIFELGKSSGSVVRLIYEGGSLKDTLNCIF